MFIDETTLKIQSGKGGNGLVAFRHEKYMEKGGPSGGNGGNGGSIIFIAKTNENTLLPLRYKKKISAEDGENGKIKNMTGKSGEDMIINVPIGTQIFNNKTGDLIADLIEKDEPRIILKGGRGGRGNAMFANSRNKAPKFAEPGESGKELEIRLELKVLADAGLVGFPSVGKSTIISVISECKPKIAAYHFTTLQPNLGMVLVPDDKSFVCADLPGLIEGASEGLGLGFQFLKHVERTKVIVHVLDGSKEEGSLFKDYESIRNELKIYDENILKKGELIVINKSDSFNFESNVNKFITEYKNTYKIEPNFLKISAMNKIGLNEMIYKIADLIDQEKDKIIVPDNLDSVVEYNFAPDSDKGFEVSKDYENLVYVVSGPKIEELLRTFNENSQESVFRFARKLKQLGVEDELKSIGCQNGDLVRIGKIQFEFTD
ncbi:GTPase ObgE [bacterium]|nr:GTPase ObgE [bacterium]